MFWAAHPVSVSTPCPPALQEETDKTLEKGWPRNEALTSSCPTNLACGLSLSQHEEGAGPSSHCAVSAETLSKSTAGWPGVRHMGVLTH